MPAPVSLRRQVQAGSTALGTDCVLAGLLDLDAPDSSLSASREILGSGLLTWTGDDAVERAMALGLGRRQAIRLRLCAQLLQRLDQENWAMPAPITAPSDVLAHVADIRNGIREQVVVLYLDSRSRPVHRELVAIGGLRSSVISPRDILTPAMGRPVASMIMVHNHPSGDTRPSPEDLQVTRQLAAAAEIFGVTLTDHLVVFAQRLHQHQGAWGAVTGQSRSRDRSATPPYTRSLWPSQ